MKTRFLRKTTYILISLLLLSIGFISCNNDDDDLSSNYSTSLIGKWKVTVDETSDIYVVTFNSDNTALIEQYKEFEKNGVSEKGEECRVTWNVENKKMYLTEVKPGSHWIYSCYINLCYTEFYSRFSMV